MAFGRHALMCVKVKLINHDCLPILMLLCIILCILLLYLMLLVTLSNAVCLHNAYFFTINFANAFCVYALSWVNDTVCLF